MIILISIVSSNKEMIPFRKKPKIRKYGCCLSMIHTSATKDEWIFIIKMPKIQQQSNEKS